MGGWREGIGDFFMDFSNVIVSRLRGFCCFNIKKTDLRRGGYALSRSVFLDAFALFSIMSSRIKGGAPTISRGTL